MIKFIHKTSIDFISKRFIFFAISGFLILSGFISMGVKGLNFGLDFTGGTLLQVKFEKPVKIQDIRSAMKKTGLKPGIQEFTGHTAFAIKVKGSQENVNDVAEKIISGLKENIKNNSFIEEQRDYVGPVVGRALTKKAIFAMIFALFGIITYIAFRFSNPVWGAAGVVALAHDIFITLGALSITNREIDLVIIAALLAIGGYSINDTIVIFDRMRENIKKFPRMRLGELINQSVNETLSRTIITSLTTITVVFILFIFGGNVINNFAFAMLIGCLSGTYSTIAIASSVVYQWSKRGR
ncbi:MAG: protein translocase subunit SecF [Elusimicrobiales bacterium]|nr:protein translocase subunit SecF [Elusimicrobiales bacterium]